MSDTYNGWTNYATWRVNLEIFDSSNPSDYYGSYGKSDAYTLGKELKEYAEELIENTSDAGLARDYALAFLSDVNWSEIAENILSDLEEEE